jgi:hypothetical protein
MKNLKFLMLLVLVVFFPLTNAFAVSEAALLFLLISPSPRANGMGDTFMALPANDAMASIYNPGSLGIFALQNYAFIGFYPHHVQWLPSLTSGEFYNCDAINFGFKINKGIFAGIGYHRISLDLGDQYFTNSRGNPIAAFQSWERVRALTFGIGGNFGVKIGLGMSIKYIESQLGGTRIDSVFSPAKADIFAYDLGGVVQVPLFEILHNSIYLPFTDHLRLQPLFVSAIGYSINNYGGEVTYTDEAQADPIPRVARIGYSIDAGILMNYKKTDWRLISFKWAREAEDLFVKRNGSQIKYQSGLGDIDFFHDLIEWKSNPNIVKRQGWELNFGEIFYYRKGKYEDPEGQVFYKTTGYGIGIAGLLKLTQFVSTNQTLKFFVDHFDIQYHWSEIEISPINPLYGTKFKGLNLVIK